MNRKAMRKARKSAAKAAGDIVVSVADDKGTCVEELPSMETRPAEDTIKYECCICRDDLPFSEGIAHCAEHFMCNDCVVDAYNAALADTEAFPAQCCTPLPHRLVEHLLSPEVREAYSLKAQEYYTPRAIRVYCVNEHCRSFIPKCRVDNNHAPSTVARCGCGTDTCIGCKHEWQGQEHRCADSEEPGVRPKWMPEYSDSYRAKSCPNCRVWMEHKEACNHMTCHYCRHEFCFVCLQPWTSEGFHQGDGCPSYGDPVEGYDGEGYEPGDRGLHRDTGYNRAGLDRFGQQQLSHAVAEANSVNEDGAYSDHEDLDLDEYYVDYGDDEQHGDNEQADENAAEDEIELDQADPELTSVEAISSLATTGREVDTAQYESASAASIDEADPVETTTVTLSDLAPVTQRRPRPSPPSDLVRQRIRLSRRVPILAPNPHPDNWVSTAVFQVSSSSNAITRGNDDKCCTGQTQWECAASLVDIVIWAENGVVTYKAERRQASEQLKDELWADCDGDWLGLATMIEVYETQLSELQPYLYWDFGIQLMFEELELEMRKEYWAVTKEDVGAPGLTLTFDLATNPFAPLYWDE